MHQSKGMQLTPMFLQWKVKFAGQTRKKLLDIFEIMRFNCIFIYEILLTYCSVQQKVASTLEILTINNARLSHYICLCY